MMTEEEVLKIFADTGALLEGHFELRSKLHSNRYFQCANVLRYPRIAGRLCDELVAKMKSACDIGKVDGVISPAVGGILVGHEVARALDVKCVFAEKVQGEGGSLASATWLRKTWSLRAAACRRPWISCALRALKWPR